ncbi:MAG TPA: acyl-CoA dehydrogenase [Gammaproteobacteria bacterium]|jgi:alkylation response protein AidB-like acyl-CoA dehydrogenase|nr:acyl-CoA dehydrogenase [Gammaproteobacteria bacterium]
MVGTLVILVLVWSMAFFPLPLLVWMIIIGAAGFACSWFGYFSALPFVIFWLLYLTAVCFFCLKKKRQQLLIAPLLPSLRKKIPTSISKTEQEAIEAGDTWWEKVLFSGRPNWKKLFEFPKPQLTQEEQQFVDQQVEVLCGMLDDWQITNNDNNLPPPVWDYLKREKFFGMMIAKEYGGRGFSAIAHSTVITKIASRCLSAAVTTMVPNSLGPAELLSHYGTTAQKQHYLPRLADGTDIPCFALTGSDAGSDAGSMTDTGVICKGHYKGEEIIGIRLQWDKRYITLAPIATVLGLAVQLYDPEKLLGGDTTLGITLCLIPTTHPGVEIGTRHYPLRQAFLNGPTRGKDVFIPLDWVIGGKEKIGAGWRMLMECLSVGRSISLPALSTACAKMAARYTTAYAQIRRQFHVPIAAFEGVEEALGNIVGYHYVIEAARMMTAGAVDLNINPSVVSAIAKYHMTELCRQVTAHAMDVHAGQMVQLGPRNFLASMHMCVPISITVEGANILTRNLIIFGQGALRCHPYLLQEMAILSAPEVDIAALDRVLMSHAGYFISHLMRSIAYGLTGGRLIFASRNQRRIKRLERQLTRMSAALALVSDISLMLLGGQLKRRERLSARLGDMLSQLYLASAVLKYYHDHGRPMAEVDYVCWGIRQNLYKIQLAFDGICQNFPKRWLGRLLRIIVFPWGQAYRPPCDSLCAAIVAPMLTPSALRDRLTQYCYQSTDPAELPHRLDLALSQAAAMEPLIKKVYKAVQIGVIPAYLNTKERIAAAETANILSSQEAKNLLAFERLSAEIIKVNEFSFDLSEVIA